MFFIKKIKVPVVIYFYKKTFIIYNFFYNLLKNKINFYKKYFKM